MMLLAYLVSQAPSSPAAEERTLQALEVGWHKQLIEFIQYDAPRILVVLVLAFVLVRVIRFFVNRMLKLADRQVANAQRASQLRTMAAIIRATAYAVIGFIVLLHVLSIFDINLTPLLASAGVLGVGIGLGAQSIFKDMINGVLILVEDQYNVGDTVKIAGVAGTVEDMSLRRTTLRDGDGTLHMIPNSQIATVSNLSRDFAVASLNLSVDASADPDHVMRVLKAVAMEVRKDPAFKEIVLADPDVPGLDQIKGREVVYPVNVRVRINQKEAVLRALRLRVIKAFEKEGIPLGTDPTSLLVMQHADPTAPPAQQPLIG
jgi:small conductance mechanosensitive channel